MSLSNLRVVLLGKTGSGKSSLGNTLLGRDEFHVEKSSCFSSVTFKCQWAEAVRFGTLLQVTDTPGISDNTGRSEDEVLNEVAKSVALASPGPHIIIMVLRCDVVFTLEEHNAYKILKRMFGDNICNHLLIVFSRCEGGAQDLAQAIKTAPQTLREVLNDAGGRYCGVNNAATCAERGQQARTIITTMQELASRNGGAYFTNQMCERVTQEVETVVQRRMKTADHPTREAALRETKRDIVEDKAEPGFFTKLKDAVVTYVLPAIGTILGLVVPLAIRAALSKCSVM